MAPHLLRALSSTLLVGAALHCAATDAGEPTVDPQNIFTIPEKGLEADEQKEVWLGPSKALRVVDNTRAAVLFPQQGDNPLPAPSPEQMSAVAYVFENGVCDFEKTVEYKKLFPGHEKPLWVRTAPAAAAGAEEASPAPAANYTFTNPSAEVLGGEGASFCVRFRVQRPLQPQPPTQAPGDTSLGGDNGKGGKDRSGPKDLVESSPQEQAPLPSQNGTPLPGAGAGISVGGAAPQGDQSIETGVPDAPLRLSGDLENGDEEDPVKSLLVKDPALENAHLGEYQPQPQPPPHPLAKGNNDHGEALGDGVSAAPDPSRVQQTDGNERVENADGPQADAQNRPASAEPDLQAGADQLNSGGTEEKQARLRILSAPTESQDKYLTIVVHSAARRAAGGSVAAAALLAAAACLLWMS
ncbi:Toxoplasma gondii family A protein [Besnoitia besnoiti]|uniref:Toxoplasma gondii family A protein n=1 Tax=Besnoitia besnoiti TaxID=94643 RepID=A0A2A9MMH0_BESBE|nr:Toxoplasma gondii family A protein [Besnoitia besnoiti]PFH36732.1 Toxoplasma gondii family A protein [Besnoitia besnoiti]